jgi:hypothetical protein
MVKRKGCSDGSAPVMVFGDAAVANQQLLHAEQQRLTVITAATTTSNAMPHTPTPRYMCIKIVMEDFILSLIYSFYYSKRDVATAKNCRNQA